MLKLADTGPGWRDVVRALGHTDSYGSSQDKTRAHYKVENKPLGSAQHKSQDGKLYTKVSQMIFGYDTDTQLLMFICFHLLESAIECDKNGEIFHPLVE